MLPWSSDGRGGASPVFDVDDGFTDFESVPDTDADDALMRSPSTTLTIQLPVAVGGDGDDDAGLDGFRLDVGVPPPPSWWRGADAPAHCGGVPSPVCDVALPAALDAPACGAPSDGLDGGGAVPLECTESIDTVVVPLAGASYSGGSGGGGAAAGRVADPAAGPRLQDLDGWDLFDGDLDGDMDDMDLSPGRSSVEDVSMGGPSPDAVALSAGAGGGVPPAAPAVSIVRDIVPDFGDAVYAAGVRRPDNGVETPPLVLTFAVPAGCPLRAALAATPAPNAAALRRLVRVDVVYFDCSPLRTAERRGAALRWASPGECMPLLDVCVSGGGGGGPALLTVRIARTALPQSSSLLHARLRLRFEFAWCGAVYSRPFAVLSKQPAAGSRAAPRRPPRAGAPPSADRAARLAFAAPGAFAAAALDADESAAGAGGLPIVYQVFADGAGRQVVTPVPLHVPLPEAAAAALARSPGGLEAGVAARLHVEQLYFDGSAPVVASDGNGWALRAPLELRGGASLIGAVLSVGVARGPLAQTRAYLGAPFVLAVFLDRVLLATTPPFEVMARKHGASARAAPTAAGSKRVAAAAAAGGGGGSSGGDDDARAEECRVAVKRARRR